MLQTLFAPIQYLHRVWIPLMPSSWLPLSLLTSLPFHLTLFSVCFHPSALSPSYFLWLPMSCFVSFSSFLHFLLFAPFLVILGFLVSGVLTTSPHFPSSDPSGPETPSSSAHRPLPPPEVLTPQHTALCAAVTPWASGGASLSKCVCPLVVP